jgi:large repetitive protein
MLPISVEDSNTVAGSLIRNPDGKDTNDAAADWAFTTTLTRGSANVMTP